MKKLILVSTFILLSYQIIAQAVAYPATYFSPAVSNCLDLTNLNTTVKGYQLNYDVDYFPTLSDAQNNTNELSEFYTYSSYDETLYARVTSNNLSSDFAISEITIELYTLPCCPPPPPGYNSYVFCDTDNNGEEVAHLGNLKYLVQYGYPPNSLCDLDESEIIVTYHLSQNDADNDLNPLDEIYTFTENTEIYYKTKSTVDGTVYISQFGIIIENCTFADTDNDGIQDYDEDVNENGNYFDDDTDNDGLMNYEDADDDNDSILTINEDYNFNGDPTDDDINNNGFPDYLESTVTLSITEVAQVTFEISDNPVGDYLNAVFSGVSEEKKISIFDINGKEIVTITTFEAQIRYDVSMLKSGVYFISAEIGNTLISKKIIKI